MKDASAKKKARKIAKLFGIEVSYERGLYSYWVEGPESIYKGEEAREDPLDWYHVAFSGRSVLNMVSRLAWDIACHRAEISSQTAMQMWDDCDREKLLDVALRGEVLEVCQTVDLFMDKDPRII